METECALYFDSDEKNSHVKLKSFEVKEPVSFSGKELRYSIHCIESGVETIAKVIYCAYASTPGSVLRRGGIRKFQGFVEKFSDFSLILLI